MTQATGAGRLSFPAALVFSLSALPTTAMGLAILVYVSPYFASHLGVPLAVVGAAFAIVRGIDFFVDPLLGMVMDRTRTRLGRYRIWQIAGAPILMLGVYRLFLAPHGIGETYLIGWLLVLYLGSSILDLSRPAWTATLATQYDERSRIFGIMTAVAVIGSVAILFIPILAGRLVPPGGSSVPLMGVFLLIVTPLTIGLPVLMTPERVTVAAPGGGFSPRDYLALVRRPALIRLFLAQICVSLGPNWMSAMYLFFFTTSRGFTAGQASILLAVYILSAVVGAPANAYLATRIGKHRTLIVTTTAFSAALSTTMLFPRGNMLAVLPVMIWCGFMASGFNLMISAMAADLGDEVRLDQGHERISLIYAMLSFANKIAGAVSIALTYSALAAIGYRAVEGAVNTPAAIHGLEATFLIGPIVFVMLGGACMIGWRLDARRHGEIRRQLDARDTEMAAIPPTVPSPLAAESLYPNTSA